MHVDVFTRLPGLWSVILKSRCLFEAGHRYNLAEASSTRHGRVYDLQFRSLMSRSELNRLSFDECNRLSRLRTSVVERPNVPLGLRCLYGTHAARDQKSQKMLMYLTGLVFVMVGCSYAAVPLYRRFCQATGYGGTVQRRESVEEKIARHAQDGTVTTREIVVQFNADVADGMPWKFIPTQREVRVKPGESALAFYTAENRSSTPITGVSTYNVTPMKIGGDEVGAYDLVLWCSLGVYLEGRGAVGCGGIVLLCGPCICSIRSSILGVMWSIGRSGRVLNLFGCLPLRSFSGGGSPLCFCRVWAPWVLVALLQAERCSRCKVYLTKSSERNSGKLGCLVSKMLSMLRTMAHYNRLVIPFLNVSAKMAAVYFNKIQCFCFEEQRLLPGEQIDMPVFFYIDPEFEADPRMDGINNLILSYTFFKVAEE
ncbi:hypothetical protein RJ639_003365 [Escallonia herrerae]|uniref:Cytochrome c oxidase assembly protein COX11, mitochondrial n=1 Tax=Escallonia herrerae TaxID=1293975 RepID=A0AA88W3B8_9ASTE|nr:hypothetical protein RJ639_003365 [Escallonia herrerae]